MLPRPPRSPLFPYTTLFRSLSPALPSVFRVSECERTYREAWAEAGMLGEPHLLAGQEVRLDRKSTRLNSSHVSISYAVFGLKKKIKLGLLSKSAARLA